MRAATHLLAWALAATAARGGDLPGPRPDGTTVLHNQWSIHPVGEQVPMGEFPVSIAVNPQGSLAAVLHAGDGAHEIRLVDLATRRVVGTVALNEGFFGLAFSPDGSTLAASGASDGVLHLFSASASGLRATRDVPVSAKEASGVVSGFALSHDMGSAVVALAFDSRVIRVDLRTGSRAWATWLGSGPQPAGPPSRDASMPNDGDSPMLLNRDSHPLGVVWDEGRNRAYVSLWGESSVAVLDASTGRKVGSWSTGLHPNEMVLSRDGRLFVSNGGLNTVSVLDARDGGVSEVLSSAFSPGDPPGATPDSLALSPDGATLYVANAYTDTVAVFDVSRRGAGRPLGFIPTGWFPTCVRATPDGKHLLVLSARGLTPMADPGTKESWPSIVGLYRGSLAVVDLSGGERTLAAWTGMAERCRPKAPPAAEFGNPIPAAAGGVSPITHVLYIIKENRTYDQVLGDLPAGNGDPSLCLFPERVTPNIHALARKFVLLDNFYANAEVSASGHEWSMAGYASEFVEKSWPVNYGHLSRGSHVAYPSEGHYAAAFPALGYLWDRAAAAGVSYRSYGEFTEKPTSPGGPVWTNLPALVGHVDPGYRGWDITYPDQLRASEFISELARFEASGKMPRLQILRLPQDHTQGMKAGSWTPEAMVADNDLAVGRVVEALSHSRFWKESVVFVVEDDAQNGPDHVDAHRTEALVAGPFVRRGAVDSTPYTTCSMLRTIELILGLEPMSVFDATAAPMRASFQPAADPAPFSAVPESVDLGSRNPLKGKAAAESARLDFSREDMADEQTLNRLVWASVHGERSRMPAPVHAAFVRGLPVPDDDDD